MTHELARALQRMVAPGTPLELTDVDLASLAAPLRYDLGRLALRRRSFPALVQCVLVVEPADVGRLVGKLPVEEPLLEALVAALERRPRIDARAADRFEQVLRRLHEQSPLPADLVPAALSLLGSLARVPTFGDHTGLLQAGQALLDDCLSGRRARPALTTADRSALLALTTSALVRPGVDPRERWVKLLLALDDADRSDVLGHVAGWAPLDVRTLTDRPRLAELLQRRALDDQVARPLLQGAAEDASSADVLRLLAVPEAMLRLLPAQQLAGDLQRLAQDDTTVAQGAIFRLRTGVAWRDLPAEFGPWQTVWKRHYEFCNDGTWDKVLTALQVAADGRGEIDWRVSVDSTIARVHQQGATAARSRSKSTSYTGGTVELQQSAV